jgi:hypothetical protein
MQLLASLLQESEHAVVRDNALAALASLTLSYSAEVPLDQVYEFVECYNQRTNEPLCLIQNTTYVRTYVVCACV